MKNSLKFTLAGLLLTTGSVYSQKVLETSAALEFQSFQKCIMEALQAKDTSAIGNCKESYETARRDIDKAATNPKTENSGKTLFYKGQIYIAGMYLHLNDSAYMNNQGEADFKIGLESLKRAFADSKMKKDVSTYVTQNVIQFNMGAQQLYKDENYKGAASAYELAAKFNETIGKLDSTSLYNAAVSYQLAKEYVKAAEKYELLAEKGYKPAESYANAITNYVDAKQLVKVAPLIETAIKKYPNDKDVLIAGVNYYFGVNDMKSAQMLLNKAVEQDPNNYILLYNVGTITLNQGDFDKAEASLKKAIELKPDYYEAQYQLGAVYVNKYAHLSEQLDSMNSNDPKYKEIDDQAKATIKLAVEPLEKYLGKYPDDKATLLNMTKIYRSLGNTDKAVEYKKRADAIQ